MFGSKDNFFQEYKLLSKLSEFIASGKIEKIEELRKLRPDLSSQIDKIVQIELFKLTGVAEQDKIEQLLKKYPELLLSSVPLKDISGIELVIDGKKGITIFQHAIWAKDVRYMCNMLLDCLPKTQKGEEIRQKLVEQCNELMEKGVVYKLNAQTHREKQFSLKPLIDALQTYVKDSKNWKSHWCTAVGLAQTLLPANVRQHYCDPEEPFENPNFRKPKFKRCLEFYNYLGNKMESWDSSLARLGISFGITRGQRGCALAGVPRNQRQSVPLALLDLAALTDFDKVRTEDLKLLIQKLQNPIQILEENQEQIFANY